MFSFCMVGVVREVRQVHLDEGHSWWVMVRKSGQ